MKDSDLFENAHNQAPEVEGEIYSVSEITSRIKHLLLQNFGTELFWIKGEISNYKGRNSQGHIYFRLKDDRAVINTAFFSYANKKLRFELEEGMQVFARGKIGLYEPQGSYQLIIEDIRPAGLGELFLRFEQLKKKLLSEGLFDEDRKKELPFLPEKIGIITSPTGAAIRDMLRIIKNRLPSTTVIIFPVRVQGDDAKDDIETAIDTANKEKFDLDLIILGRGGGSIEELWAFNEENVARAIVRSKIPIISAVGHETDFTISDFVADLRAATPSNAVEIALPDGKELKHRLEVIFSDIFSSLEEKTELYNERLLGLLRNPILKDPMTLLRNREQTLDSLLEKMRKEVQFKFEKALSILSSSRESFLSAVKISLKSYGGRIDSLTASLSALNPLAVLDRGYSIATASNGKIIRSHSDIEIGDDVRLTLSKGELGLKVSKKETGNRYERIKKK